MSSEQEEKSTPRFNYVGDDAEMVQESDGEFVKFADYDQSLAEKQEEVEKLRAALTGAALNRRDGPCWCGELRNPSGDNHVSWCVQAKAVLNPISEPTGE